MGWAKICIYSYSSSSQSYQQTKHTWSDFLRFYALSDIFVFVNKKGTRTIFALKKVQTKIKKYPKARSPPIGRPQARPLIDLSVMLTGRVQLDLSTRISTLSTAYCYWCSFQLFPADFEWVKGRTCTFHTLFLVSVRGFRCPRFSVAVLQSWRTYVSYVRTWSTPGTVTTWYSWNEELNMSGKTKGKIAILEPIRWRNSNVTLQCFSIDVRDLHSFFLFQIMGF